MTLLGSEKAFIVASLSGGAVLSSCCLSPNGLRVSLPMSTYSWWGCCCCNRYYTIKRVLQMPYKRTRQHVYLVHV